MEHKVDNDQEKRPPNDNRKRPTVNKSVLSEQPVKKEATFWEKLKETEISKTAAIWSCLASVILTMAVGFWWGGWVTNSTALKMVSDGSKSAILNRLADVCVAQSELDIDKGQKLVDLKAASSYQRGEFVATQGWATLPGDTKPNSQVASQCAKLIVEANP